MEAAMIPTSAMTTLVNDRHVALARQARDHRLAVEATSAPGGRRPASGRRPVALVRRAWHAALAG
jgi:hypothetical protein